MTIQLDELRQAMKGIAARTHGQLANVRTIMGRDVHMMKHSSSIFLLPPLDNITPIQDQDPTSPTLGQFYSMMDMSIVDGGDVIK